MEIQSVNYYSFRSREVAEIEAEGGAKAVEEGPKATVLEENVVSAKNFFSYKKFSLQYQGSIITVTRHDGVLVSQSSAVDDLESILSSSPPLSLPVNDPYRFNASGSINDTRETG